MSKIKRAFKFAPYVILLAVLIAMIAHCCYMHVKTEQILDEYEELRSNLEQFDAYTPKEE